MKYLILASVLFMGVSEVQAMKWWEQCLGLFAPRAKSSSIPKGAPKTFTEQFDIPASQIETAKKQVSRALLTETLFIVPANDGEAVRAHQILAALNAPYVVKSRQRWGATLDREPRWEDALKDPRIKKILVFEMPSLVAEAKIAAAGKQFVLIDHHYYKGLPRTKPESSLEQLMTFLNWPASEMDTALAVNDRGFIPGLKAMKLPNDRIVDIRRYDKLGQGDHWKSILENEKRAKKDVPSVPVFDGMSFLDGAKLHADEDMVKQEIALQTESGIADVLTAKGSGFGFSGSPEIVDRFEKFDFTRYGLISSKDPRLNEYDQYGGGDPKASRFGGFKIKNPKKARKLLSDPQFLRDVWAIFRPNVPAPKEFFEAFGVAAP